MTMNKWGFVFAPFQTRRFCYFRKCLPSYLKCRSAAGLLLGGLYVGLMSPGLAVADQSSLFVNILPETNSLETGAPSFTPMLAQNGTASSDTKTTEAAEAAGGTSSDEKRDQVALLSRPASNLLGPSRPFLLHSQDATITYLMPGAVRTDPSLEHALRAELEEQALAFWQLARKIRGKLPNFSAPPFMLRSRVEDRFQSTRFTSLFWQEERQTSQDTASKTNRTFTFDHKNKKVIGLKDLFGVQDETAYEALLDLLNAYIRVDVARQKSIRLGSSIAPDQDAWLKDFSPSPENFSTFTLVPSTETGRIAGLMIHFNPGILGADADGAYLVFVPSSIFAASLQPEFAANFGGDALKITNHVSNGLSSALLHLRDLKEGDELAGSMVIEGEVPKNWCNGLHVTLLDGETIISEGAVTMEPELPGFGLSDGMIRFRVELSVNGEGGKAGQLVFEPYEIKQEGGKALLSKGHACDLSQALVAPDPIKDQVSVSVAY